MGVRFALTAALLLAGCDTPETGVNDAAPEAAKRGKRAVERLGCGACHDIPGIWPRGTTGPALANFAERGAIAGRYPNRPDTLAAFLLDPSGSAMPRQPMTANDASDIAAFLHSHGR